jgi:hypothetical protein
MKDEARFLRSQLDRIGTRRGRCVSPELRARATVWIAGERARGRAVAELAAELGVAAGTVIRWSKGVARAIVPVRIVPDAVTGMVAVVSPSGFRIEGLTIADAVHVLRELG